MSDHLPECLVPDFKNERWICICNQLRACEQRVNSSNLTLWNRTQEQSQHMITSGLGIAWKDGFKEGLDAAREAVAGLQAYDDHGWGKPFNQETAVVYRLDAIAAIDALMGRTNE